MRLRDVLQRSQMTRGILVRLLPRLQYFYDFEQRCVACTCDYHCQLLVSWAVIAFWLDGRQVFRLVNPLIHQ